MQQQEQQYVRSETAMPQKPMSFRNRYVSEKKKKTTAETKLWINLGFRNSQEVQELCKFLGTESNKEIASILKYIVADLAHERASLTYQQE
jgi:hypothetical protein